MALADLMTLDSETIDESQPLTIFHPMHTWKKRTITDYYVKELLVPVFVDGKCVYEKPAIREIHDRLVQEKQTPVSYTHLDVYKRQPVSRHQGTQWGYRCFR